MKSHNKSNNDANASAGKVIRPGDEPASTTVLHAKAWRRAAIIFDNRVRFMSYSKSYGCYRALADLCNIMADGYEEADDPS